jgi:cyclomaltodextrinase / maltogenic alpha-amylase / neopullulanase
MAGWLFGANPAVFVVWWCGMNEFIFGDLLTLEQRLDYLQGQRRGVQHQHDLVPQMPLAGDVPLLSVSVAVDKVVKEVACVLLEPSTAVLQLQPVRLEWDPLNWRYLQIWQTHLPPQANDTIVRYQIWAYPQDGSAPIPAEDGATYSYYVTDLGSPAWAASATVYQVLPDRFHPGSGRAWNELDSLADIYGGTLRGIIEHLDYIAGMGFNCLWLNPFFPDETYHGYHATDYFAVNERLGTLEELRELVDEAHGRGLRLILDFVANHWSDQHHSFQNARTDPHSPYRGWYYWIEWPDQYQAFFNLKELPKLNVDHPGVRQYLFDAARYWMDFGFDGFRLDHALGPTHDFWTAFRVAVKRHNPDAWIFGEAVGMPTTSLSYRGRFDGCLDFTLLQALRDTFAFNTMSLEAFDTFLRHHEQYFPADYDRLSFLDNHDMNRFLWLARGDKRKLKLAALCQFTLRGQPVVYYGTEVGVYQLHDVTYPDGRNVMEESRLPMLWGEEQDGELREYYRWLLQLRRDHPVLWRGGRETLLVDDTAGVYLYARTSAEEQAVVALNVGELTQEVTAVGQTFTLPPWSGEVRFMTPESEQSSWEN